MELEKAYDTMDMDALWPVICLYGLGGKLF